MLETVTLRIGGRQWRGWTEVRVSTSLRDVASAFVLRLTYALADAESTLAIVPDSDVQILTRAEGSNVDDLLMTGALDSDDDNETTEIKLEVQGRSNTGRLVKGSVQHDTGVFRGLTPLQIAQQICAPHGIAAVSTVDTGAALDLWRLEQGEKAFDALERLGRERGLILTDDTAGRLIMCRAGTVRTAALIHGQGLVKSWGHKRSASDRYTEYRVVGQNASNDTIYGEDATGCQGYARDTGWTTKEHSLTIIADRESNPAACQARAEYEAAIRAGKSTTIMLKTYGWRTPDGQLWRKNTISRVVHPRRQIDADYLISDVEYQIGEQGTEAVLTLVPPSAFAVQPPQKGRISTNWKEDWGIN